mmetsp:Transcript_96778/g.166849  ORF Transcript_96778/g.166849 Transcript_96778/m.166849 type:complete len:414 (+) Transcript_96778:1065-2306(+)
MSQANWPGVGGPDPLWEPAAVTWWNALGGRSWAASVALGTGSVARPPSASWRASDVARVLTNKSHSRRSTPGSTPSIAVLKKVRPGSICSRCALLYKASITCCFCSFEEKAFSGAWPGPDTCSSTASTSAFSGDTSGTPEAAAAVTCSPKGGVRVTDVVEDCDAGVSVMGSSSLEASSGDARLLAVEARLWGCGEARARVLTPGSSFTDGGAGIGDARAGACMRSSNSGDTCGCGDVDAIEVPASDSVHGSGDGAVSGGLPSPTLQGDRPRDVGACCAQGVALGVSVVEASARSASPEPPSLAAAEPQSMTLSCLSPSLHLLAVALRPGPSMAALAATLSAGSALEMAPNSFSRPSIMDSPLKLAGKSSLTPPPGPAKAGAVQCTTSAGVRWGVQSSVWAPAPPGGGAGSGSW